MSEFNQRLAAFAAAGQVPLLKGIRRGIEKESLRITPAGELAQTPHSPALGSALTHPQITTDYSEALLEFITEPHSDIDALLGQLRDIHRYTYANIGDETLWSSSMPCMLGRDEQIPVGQYGSSNVGHMKSVYRLGLGHRYGRLMQTIAGIHYNFSLPDALWESLHQQADTPLSLQDFKTERYFGLIRNFRRYFWLLIYLFGAAPAVCRTFVRNRDHQLEPFGADDHSLHAPLGTSLRMGDLGYQSSAQEQLIVCYNNLETYLKTLCGAITQSHPDYEELGLKGTDGDYRQLSTGLLQIENEFYSTIRPKRTADSGETALSALQRGGVEYIEVRCLDLNPYEPLGINTEQIHLLDSFLVFCLLEDSPETHPQEYRNIQENQKRIVNRGRDPELTLLNGSAEQSLADWGSDLLTSVGAVADMLDSANGGTQHRAAVDAQQAKLQNPALTPSARVLNDMREQQVTFFRLAMNLSEQHRKQFQAEPLDPAVRQAFEQEARESLERQAAVEAADEIDFDAYLAAYYAQYHCCN